MKTTLGIILLTASATLAFAQDVECVVPIATADCAIQAAPAVYETPVVYTAPVVYEAPVVYNAPVVYHAPVYYAAPAQPVIAYSYPQQECAPRSTVVFIGGGRVSHSYSPRRNYGSTVTYIGRSCR